MALLGYENEDRTFGSAGSSGGGDPAGTSRADWQRALCFSWCSFSIAPDERGGSQCSAEAAGIRHSNGNYWSWFSRDGSYHSARGTRTETRSNRAPACTLGAG